MIREQRTKTAGDYTGSPPDPHGRRTRGRRLRHPALPAGGCALAAFLVYLLTLAPSIYWGDGPELTSAAYAAGIPHPTGYPLYMLLAHAVLRGLPLASPAYEMNLLSALSAAAAVAGMALLLFTLTGSRAAAASGALLLAFGQTFWSQAVIAEVYAFHMALVCALLAALAAWERSGRRNRLYAAAVLYGLSLAHHLMAVLLAPALLLFAMLSRRRGQFVRELPRTVLLFLLPLMLYVYLPIRALADPPLNWGDPRTRGNFVAHVTGAQFRSRMLHAGTQDLQAQWARYAGPGGFLPQQWGWAPLLLAPLGLAALRRRSRPWFTLSLAAYLVSTAYALSYSIPDVDVYYLPSHAVLVLWMACGLAVLLRRAVRRGLRLAGAVLCALPLLPLLANWEVNDLHADYDALAFGRIALEALKPKAVLFLGGGMDHFPLFYAHYVEGRRPDVTFVDVVDLRVPSRVRLITRLAKEGPAKEGPAKEGLVVRVPPGVETGPDGFSRDDRFFAQLVADNIGRRPLYVYLLVSPDYFLNSEWVRDGLRGRHAVLAGNFHVAEIRASPPEISPRPALGPPLGEEAAFGRPLPGGGETTDLVLTGADGEIVRREGVDWLRLQYHWRVRDARLVRHARVHAILSTLAGQYAATRDGRVLFHNVRYLGERALPDGPELPPRLTERFDLFVPPALRGQPLRINVGVEVGGRYLIPHGSRETIIDAGHVPPLPPFRP